MASSHTWATEDDRRRHALDDDSKTLCREVHMEPFADPTLFVMSLKACPKCMSAIRRAKE